MPGGICILEGLVPFSVSLFGKFNLICFSVVFILLNISLAVTWGTLNYLKQQLQPTLLKTWRGCWTTSLRGRSQELPSPHRLPVWEGGKLGLFRPGKMPSFKLPCVHKTPRRCFFQQFPMMVVPQEHGHHFYWKTQRGVLLILKKQPQTKGGGLLSSADLISMSCSGKFGLFLFGWTLTTVPSFLQCCNWARASSQCVFCNQFAVAQVLHFQT